MSIFNVERCVQFISLKAGLFVLYQENKRLFSHTLDDTQG